MWQIGPILSSGIRWCLALASVRPQWCLLWRFLCVCMCVCAGEWWSGPCMCDGSLLNLCYLCQLWYMKPRDASTVTHKWCLRCLHQLCHVGMPMLTRCHWQCLDRLSQIFATLCKVCFYGWFYIENELNAGNFALDWIIGPCCRCNLGVLVRRFNISENM